MSAIATRPAEPRAASKASEGSWWQLIKQTFSEWSEDKAPRLGAALAYYTIFSLPPLLVIVIAILATIFNPEDVQTELNGQFKSMLGEEGQQAIASLIAGAQKGHSGVIATVVRYRRAHLRSGRLVRAAQGRAQHDLGSAGQTRPGNLGDGARLLFCPSPWSWGSGSCCWCPYS